MIPQSNQLIFHTAREVSVDHLMAASRFSSRRILKPTSPRATLSLRRAADAIAVRLPSCLPPGHWSSNTAVLSRSAALRHLQLAHWEMASRLPGLGAPCRYADASACATRTDLTGTAPLRRPPAALHGFRAVLQ